jgi:hypothetical protein
MTAILWAIGAAYACGGVLDLGRVILKVVSPEPWDR